jgi:hypothetical protein
VIRPSSPGPVESGPLTRDSAQLTVTHRNKNGSTTLTTTGSGSSLPMPLKVTLPASPVPRPSPPCVPESPPHGGIGILNNGTNTVVNGGSISGYRNGIVNGKCSKDTRITGTKISR